MEITSKKEKYQNMQNEYFTKQWRHFINGDDDWDSECYEDSVFADTLDEAVAIIELWEVNMNMEPPYIDKYFDANLGIFKSYDSESNQWIEFQVEKVEI